MFHLSSPVRFLPLVLAICMITVLFHASWIPSLGKLSPDSYPQTIVDPVNQQQPLPSTPEAEPPVSQSYHNNGKIHNIQNRTLGFQEVRMISLPERTDKRDAFAVMASVSNFDYKIVDGVNGSEILKKALPYKMNQTDNVVGCWRAHMNALEDMVRRGVSTLLVFEDDSDWDVALRYQLVQLAYGVQWLLDLKPNVTESSEEAKITVPGMSRSYTPDSPYGSGWDFLWLGHCGAQPDPWDDRRFVIHRDPTVEPSAFRSYGASPDMYHWEEQAAHPDYQTRIIISQYYGVCTAAYAVSLEGAKKLLYYLSMHEFNNPLDIGISDLCKTKSSNFTCLGAYPPIVGVHRPAGHTSAWSDVDEYDDKIETEAKSERVVFSTRMNIDRFLAGSTLFRGQYGTWTGHAEMEIEKIGRAQGKGERINIGIRDSIV